MRTLLHVASAAAVCVTVAGCQVPVPTQPSGEPQLQIRGSTLLMVGGRGRLTAWEPGGGRMREVRATWSAEGDAISITSDGAVTGRRLGRSIVRASAGDLTGTTTVHVVTDVAGKWRGSITVVECSQAPVTTVNACEGRIGTNAPLLLDVTQSASGEEFGNLGAVVEIFTPPARGNCFGALDSSGFFFLDGTVVRQADGYSGGVKFKWQLEGEQLVPFNFDSLAPDTVDVQMAMRIGSSTVSLNETWRVSVMTR